MRYSEVNELFAYDRPTSRQKRICETSGQSASTYSGRDEPTQSVTQKVTLSVTQNVTQSVTQKVAKICANTARFTPSDLELLDLVERALRTPSVVHLPLATQLSGSVLAQY